MFTRFIVAAPVALAISAAFIAAAVPAFAAPMPSTCTTMPTQLRAAANTATTDRQKSALILISTGERLCAVDATSEAAKKFAAAARALGVDMAALPGSTTASSQ
nr:hypothetical protein [Polymorphobacter sp.]